MTPKCIDKVHFKCSLPGQMVPYLSPTLPEKFLLRDVKRRCLRARRRPRLNLHTKPV